MDTHERQGKRNRNLMEPPRRLRPSAQWESRPLPLPADVMMFAMDDNRAEAEVPRRSVVVGLPPVDASDEEMEAWAHSFVGAVLGPLPPSEESPDGEG